MSKASYQRHRAQRLADMKSYYAANKERILEQKRLYRSANREKVQQRNALWRSRNAEALKERNRAAYAGKRDEINAERRTNPVKKAEARRKAKLFRDKNPGYYTEYLAAWREAHRAEAVAMTRAWQKKNPSKVKAHNARRRALKRGARSGDQQLVQAFIVQISQAKRLPCYWCGCSTGKRNGRHVDHIVPLAKGGKHEVGNLCVSCASCNSRKSDRDAAEFSGQFQFVFTSL